MSRYLLPFLGLALAALPHYESLVIMCHHILLCFLELVELFAEYGNDVYFRNRDVNVVIAVETSSQFGDIRIVALYARASYPSQWSKTDNTIIILRAYRGNGRSRELQAISPYASAH
jgi:hypothetical protein